MGYETINYKEKLPQINGLSSDGTSLSYGCIMMKCAIFFHIYFIIYLFVGFFAVMLSFYFLYFQKVDKPLLFMLFTIC